MKQILIAFLLLTLASCKEKAAEAVADSPISYAMEAPATEEKVEVDAMDLSKPNANQSIESKIIREANIRFESSDLEATNAQIKSAVKKFKASIQNESEGKNYESIFRNTIVRVPSKDFDAFISEISKGVNYFDQKQISSQDVTEEYIDIDARLKAKKVLENRYLELLKKASKVSEMLEIETQLSSVREEIEAKEAQLRYMQNRVSMSTVTIEFYKPLAEESGATISYGSKIGNALKSGFNGISNFFIGLIALWPFIIILVAVIFLIRRRFKKKRP